MTNPSSVSQRFARGIVGLIAGASMVGAPLLTLPAPVHAVFPGYNGKIALHMTNPDHGTLDIYLVNVDGTGLTNLTNDPAADHSPAWSPDGAKIAFASNRDGLGFMQIYVMDADGANQTRLTFDSVINTVPNWSPDGTKIAFRRGQGAGGSEREVYVMDADGSNQVNLTNNAVIDENPVWSPDGLQVVFQSNRDGNSEIYVMAPDGSDQTRLTDNPAIDARPSYAPDGTKIAFASDRDGGGIYLMNRDGTGVEQVVLGASAGKPDWQSLPNQPPITTNVSATTQVNTATVIDALANDTDPEGELDPTSVTVTVGPNHGTASVNATNGRITYTPSSGFVGSDSLTYQVCDSFILDQKCSTAVLSITVQAGPVPAKPTITSVGTVQMNGASTVYYTGHRPTFSGTAQPGTIITVLIESNPIVLTTTTESDGHWSVTPDQDIPDGEHTVTITATKDGATSEAFTFVLGINTFIPATGARTNLIRVMGMALLVGGAGLHLHHRRRPRRSYGYVPPLFPLN